MKAKPNQLHYGDNLEVLPTLPSDSVDLVYLDPPFNSQQDYNLLFHEFDGSKAAAQRLVFSDTWTWRPDTATAYRSIVDGGGGIAKCMLAMKAFLGDGDLMAYLVMMAPRLSELHRVLKPTGSLYLHCDPTASHYLKILLDSIFGLQNFRNEIVWLRSKNPKGSQHRLRRYSPFTDTLLYYVKTQEAPVYLDRIRPALSPEALSRKYQYSDEHGPYADGPILRSASMGPRPNLVYEYKGFTPGPAGWRVERPVLEEIDRKGNLNWTGTGVRRKLRPSDIERGQPIGSFWGDIPPINSQAQERLGYPTQKPEALLERIIEASTNPGDIVLDPFCGCGTTIAVAHRSERRWIGIDVTARAIEIVENRLKALDPFAEQQYSLHGKPLTFEDAKRLALDNGYQFQRWILELMDVLPRDIKPGADGGIDGRLYFIDAPSAGRTSEVIFSVKGGKNIGPDPVRALAGVTNGRAKIGVFVCFKATEAMMREVANAEPFRSIHGDFPSLQLLTVADVLAGKRPLYPGAVPQVRAAHKTGGTQLELKPIEQPSLYKIEPRMMKARLKSAKRPAARASSKQGSVIGRSAAKLHKR